MKEFLFKGLMAPVFTPACLENSQDVHVVISEYAKYLSGNGIEGILVNGTVGEGVSMNVKRRKQILERWLQVNTPLKRFTVMVQIGGTNFEDVKELAKHAEGQNVDALLCLPELFFKPQDVDELVCYLYEVHKQSPNTPLFYYHIPSFTHVNIDMESLVRKCVKQIPSFKGIKFTHNNLEELQRAMEGNQSVHFFLGCDQLILKGLQYGCYSQIATMINICPKTIQKIVKNQNEGNLQEAQKIQERLTSLVESISRHGHWVSTMKYAFSYKIKFEGVSLTSLSTIGPALKPLSSGITAKIAETIDQNRDLN